MPPIIGHHQIFRGDKSMAAITAALIKQVREETGAGMMDVRRL